MDQYQKEAYMQIIARAIGDEKLTHFASRAKISAGNLSRIRKGQPANPETLRKIADASDFVTYPDLMRAAGLSEERLADPVSEREHTGIIRVPIVEKILGSKEDLLADESLSYEEIYAFSLEKGDYIYFIANDDAVVPKGSRVLVNLTKEPSEGDTLLLLIKDNEAMLRHLTKHNRTYFYYGDDLKKYPMTAIKKSQFKIFGVAVQANITL